MATSHPQSPPVPWRFSLLAVWRFLGMAWVVMVGAWSYVMRRENRSTRAGRAAWLSRTCAHALQVLHVRVTESGKRPDGAMLTPNHIGYLDILVLASLSPTAFVAKSEVERWPVFGWFAAKAGTLFLRRERKSDLVRVGEQIAPVLAAGINLVAFLEGTSTDGSEVRRFRPGLLEPLVQIRRSAVPTTLSYRVPPGHDAALEVAWWGTMPLVPHLLGMLSLPWIEVRVDWGEPFAATTDRKVLAEALETAVREGLRRAQDS